MNQRDQSPITSNPEDWSFALSSDGVLTADQKEALLYQVLYDIIHGVNLPYVEGSSCFPGLITTDSLTDGTVDQPYAPVSFRGLRVERGRQDD